ncbi:MAG: hypothetical protein PVJ67_00035 [Candidatus Pacearchaeota archaeon]|jgi:hypothetical protein
MKRNYDEKDLEEKSCQGYSLASAADAMGYRGRVHKPRSSQPPKYPGWYVRLFKDAFENAARKNSR